MTGSYVFGRCDVSMVYILHLGGLGTHRVVGVGEVVGEVDGLGWWDI